MSHEHKAAVAKIVQLCERHAPESRLWERVLDIGYESMGMTSGQRAQEIVDAKQRVIQRKRDEIAAKQGVVP